MPGFEAQSRLPEASGASGQAPNQPTKRSEGKKTSSLLEQYRAREELTWIAESKEILSLVWLLRLKHEEAQERANDARCQGGIITILAIVVLVITITVTLYGWHRVIESVQTRSDENTKRLIDVVVPPHLWQLAVATTATVVLLAGVATLLFNVARNYHQRLLLYTVEMDATRRIEAAVRLALSSGIAPSDAVKAAFVKLGEKLIETPKSKDGDPVADLSAVPELAKQLKDLIETTIKGVKGASDK